MALRRSPMGLCSAVSPFHQNPMLKACLLCGLFALCCWGRDTFPSVPSSEGTLFAFCLLPVMFVCQSGATLGWSWVSWGVFQKGSSKKLQHTFPDFPLRHFLWWLGLGIRPTVGSHPIATSVITLVNVVILYSSVAGVTLELSCLCWSYLHTPWPWHHAGWGWDKSILEVVDLWYVWWLGVADLQVR